MAVGEGQEFLDFVEEVAGAEMASLVQKTHGGTRVYVVACPRPDHWLSVLMGHDLAVALCSLIERESIGFIIGNGMLMIPMGETTSAFRRRREIERLTGLGWSSRRIAREVGVHIRTVHRHHSRLKKSADRKPDA